MAVLGLTQAKDARFQQEQAVLFAARSQPVEPLKPEEQAALENYVKLLSER
jgi:hypothetical protein